MALTMTASAGVQPPSPPALMPNGLVGDSTSTISVAKDGRLWQPGEIYPLRGHSFALFINRAPADAPIARTQDEVELDCTGPKAEGDAPPS